MIDINLILQITEKLGDRVKWFKYSSRETYHTTLEVNGDYCYFLQIEFKDTEITKDVGTYIRRLETKQAKKGTLLLIDSEAQWGNNEGRIGSSIPINRELATKLHKAIEKNILAQQEQFNNNLKELLI